MATIQEAIEQLVVSVVAQAVSGALSSIRERVTALENSNPLTVAERAALDKVVEFVTAIDGLQAPTPNESVTITDVL